ncbi:MAG: HAMP domain-containing histidine kinase, partial [Chloroflexi bacterium]|nr:HAMP domain-containing histidine kinase [Chloroflexota bacterium]
MWDRIPVSAVVDPDFASAATELLQSTFRKLVLVTMCACTVWYLAVAQLPGTLGMELLPVAGTVLLACGLALALVIRQFVLARVLWQLGLVVAVTVGICVSGQTEIAFLYALWPLIAVVTMSWPVGVLAEGLLIGLLSWLSYGSAAPSLSMTLIIEVALAGGLAGLLGWAATDTLLTVTHWSLFSYEQAHAKMEEARLHRMELKQVEEDLLHANRELVGLTDRLRAMQQLAEEAKRAKQEFVANVSHELRTPLNMIIGFSEMIMQSPRVYGAELPRAVLADIHAIERNSQHLSKLVDDVLDLSQIEAGRVALIRERFDLKDIIDDAAGAVRALFESKGLYLETEAAPDLPAVFCDAIRIRQVVLNLLSNAGRYTDRGGVHVKAWCEEKRVVVSVTDTGPGIAVEEQSRLFEPFHQLDGSLRRRHGGSGLGLSISKQFIELHGGEMWLASEVGAGTTFSFCLPIEAPLDHEAYGGDDIMRWFNPDYQPEARTRRSKAPAPTVSPR